MNDYSTRCIECTANDTLQVISGNFYCVKMQLAPDGFDFTEAKQLSTDNVILECSTCTTQFELKEYRHN
jgi:hypothetical protein